MRIVSLLFHDVFVRDPAESGFVSPAADRYKLSRPDFDAQLEGLARACPETAIHAQLSTSDPQLSTTEDTGDTEAFNGKLLDRQSAILCPRVLRVLRGGEVGSLPFLITVDDGGVSYYTVVADRLEELGWRGHCFVTTDRVGQKGFLTAIQIRELDARGHVIGTHSASHPARFSACPIAGMLNEWTRSRDVLENLLGHRVTVASVPGGYFSAAVARTAAEAGLRLLFTSEPTTRPCAGNGCVVAGRFTVRANAPHDFARRLVAPPPRTRRAEWASWNAKKMIKPLLGSTYSRVADWLIA